MAHDLVDSYAAAVTADGSKTLLSERYGQSFHSDKGALTEARHVFLAASGVAERLAHSQPSRVLEVGFGTGLNFFLTADLALEAGAALHYVALEQTLLTANVVSNLEYAQHLQTPGLIDAYLSFRRQLPTTVAAGSYVFSYQQVRLELLIGNASEPELSETFFDAVYQDAFSPDANPELWTATFFTRLYTALKPGGVLTSYSVKGAVRRTLVALGFEVQKLPGPIGGKREMLRARKQSA